MSRPPPGRTRRPGPPVVVVVLCLGLLAAGLLAPPAATARPAATSDGPAVVTVDAMTPVSGSDGATLTLSGTVHNTGSTPLSGLGLVLGVGPVPNTRTQLLRDFTDRPGITRVLTNCAATCLVGMLAPGASTTYTVSVPLGRGLDRGVVAVYPLIVRILAGDGTVGEADTFLPYVPAPVSAPLRVSWVLPLDPAPVQAADGTIATAAFPAEIDPGGSLGGVLAAATAPTSTRSTISGQPGFAPVTWAVEPSLLAAATQTAHPGWRRTGDADLQPADPGSAAFLTALAASTRGSGVLALPYADPDAVAVNRAGRGLDLSAAIATARADVRSALPDAGVLAGVGWVPGDAVDRGTLDTYAAAGVSTVLLPGTQVPPTADAFPQTQSAVTTLATQGPPLQGLALDPDLQTLLAAGGRDEPTAGMSAERLLALLALSLGEAPNELASRDVVLALPRGTTASVPWLRDVLTDTGSVPWLRAIRLEQMLGDAAGDRQALAPYPASAQAAELPATTLTGPGGVADLRSRLDALAAALPDTALTQPLDLALLRAESFAWRAASAGGAALRSDVGRHTTALLADIRLAAASTVTLASRDATIPVTVENALPEPATVRVTLQATDRTKLSTSSREVVIPAGRKLRVVLPASTQRAGTFPAAVTLTTPGGLQIVQVPVTVHSRAYGAITLVITFGALGVLLLAIVVRAVRRLRIRRRPQPAA